MIIVADYFLICAIKNNECEYKCNLYKRSQIKFIAN